MKICDAGPDLLELMDHIKLRKKHKVAYLKLFMKIDKDHSGYASLIEWFAFMKIDHSPFVERAFRLMDINTEGESAMQLDVCEFFIGLFNFCFFPRDHLSKYMFDLYDDDGNGCLTQHELALMVEEVVGTGHEHLVDQIMGLLDGDG